MGGGPTEIGPLGSSVVLYVGPLWCGWHGHGVARQPVVGLGVGGGAWGSGVVIPVMLAEG